MQSDKAFPSGTFAFDLTWDVETTFIERPNRFLCTALIDSDGDGEDRQVEAHVHDPGRMQELLLPSARLRLRRASNPDRKTKWDLLAIQLREGPNEGEWVLTHTGHHRKIMENVLAAPEISPFGPLREIRPEYTVEEPKNKASKDRQAKGKDRGGGRKRKRSRLDFVVETEAGEKIAIEVKGCTCAIDGIALFPDAPTERGRRHLTTLMRLKKEGLEGRECRAAVVFLVFHPDAKNFAPHRVIDPEFADLFYEAAERGVEVYPLSFEYDEAGVIKFRKRLPVEPKFSAAQPEGSKD